MWKCGGGSHAHAGVLPRQVGRLAARPLAAGGVKPACALGLVPWLGSLEHGAVTTDGQGT